AEEKGMDMGDVEKAGALGRDEDDADDDEDETSPWTISVLFVSGGHHFEALTDDNGKIQYVYETIPLEQAPKPITEAALDEVDDGDLLYCQKVTDETKDKPAYTYVVGVGDKDVTLDLDGNVLKVKDAPPEKDDEGDDDDGGMKLKI